MEAEASHHRAIQLDPNAAGAYLNLGVTLDATGRPLEAQAAFRRAIELNPNNATVHYNLGVVLRKVGRFAESLAEYRRGHELGSRDSNWLHPSAQAVRDGERLVELDAKAAAVLAGEAQPAEAAEYVALAEFCQRHKKWYATAVRFYADAFAARPTLADDLKAGHRYNAACVAAVAAGGDNRLDGGERARLRRCGLEWLTADLAARVNCADSAGTHSDLRRTMQHWQQDPDLAGVRDAVALAELPEAERVGWQQLWAAVADLLKRKDEPTAVDKPAKKP